MRALALLGLAGGLLMAFCQWLIYVYAPVEQSMGVVQKIFYFHLPVAWWCFASFFLSCISGILWLKTRRRKWDILSAAAVEVGMVCATLALITGSIWARHSWGTWWTWDPRLTTTLVLWFIYAGYLALRSMPLPSGGRASMCAVVLSSASSTCLWFFFPPGCGVPSTRQSLRPGAEGWNRKWPLRSLPRYSVSACSGSR